MTTEPVLLNMVLTALASAATPWLAKRGIDASGTKELFSFIGAAATAIVGILAAFHARSKVTPTANITSPPVWSTVSGGTLSGVTPEPITVPAGQHVTIKPAPPTATFTGTTTFAQGGVIPPGATAIVGEAGPETVAPAQ